VVVAGGDDDVRRANLPGAGTAAGGGGSFPRAQHPAVTVRVAVDPVDVRVEPDLEPVMLGVGLEVADHVVARDPLAVTAGDAEAGQVRQPADRVQVQPVVVAAPGRREGVRAVDDDRLDAGALQHRGGGEAAGTGADDDGVVGGGHAVIVRRGRHRLLLHPAHLSGRRASTPA
jgi:hypothetical protein